MGERNKFQFQTSQKERLEVSLPANYEFYELSTSFSNINYELITILTILNNAQKEKKSRQSAKDEKPSFSLRAQNNAKHKVLGTFWEPKTPKNPFSTFGLIFPFRNVLGAKNAPKAKNGLIFTSLLPKVEMSRFCDSGRERVPETLRL